MADSKFNAESLLHMAENHSAESRNNLAIIFKDLFTDETLLLSDREKNLMFNIVDTLLQEVEASVRGELSNILADREDVPHDLFTYLANDEISVAAPILSRSKLLGDKELITIIRHRTAEHQLAITLRREISEEISDALVEAGDEDVIISLLENENANLSDSTLEYLVEQSKRVDTFQEPLIHRDELNIEMVEKLCSWVSDALRQDIATKFDLPKEIHDKYFRASDTKRAKERNIQSAASPDATSNLIKQLREKGMVTPQTLVNSLIQGEIPLFLGLFSELTKLDVNFSKSIIFDSNGEETAVACRAIGVTEMQFLTIIKKTRKQVAPGRSGQLHLNDSKLLDFYRGMSSEHANNAIKAWMVYRDDEMEP